MGRKSRSRKFIESGEGQKFFLLHRSQTDAAYANSERPTDFVLVPAHAQGNAALLEEFAASAASEYLQQKLSGGTKDEGKGGAKPQDHINALGFRNDGYDYSQHLKEMGGGTFIGRDGKQASLPEAQTRHVALPPDILPSAHELDRALHTITIDPDLMDEDLRDALFNEDPEAGEFEELQDDFINECINEPEAPNFDFDAHIAALIARSEQKNVDNHGARGWGDAKTGSSKKKKPAAGGSVRFEGDDEHDEEEEEDEDEMTEIDSQFSDDDDYDYEDEEEGGDGRRTGKASSSSAPKGQYASAPIDDDRFDRMLEEEYDSEEVGDLEDEAEDIQGTIDVNQEGTLFDSALDEYLQEKKDQELYDGIALNLDNRVLKGSRFIPGERPEEANDPTELTPELRRRMVAELEEEAAQEVPPEMIPEDVDALFASHEYLKETREEERWDCETILSTYSTLDNHPSLIKEASLNKKKKNRKGSGDDASSVNSASIASSRRGGGGSSRSGAFAVPHASTAAAVRAATDAGGPVRIVLSGRLGLPKLVTPGASGKDVASSLAKMSIKEGEEEEDNEDDDDDEEDEKSRGSGQEDEEGGADSTLRRKKGETAEEKRARKRLVKEERRQNRTFKKQLKGAFASEQRLQANVKTQDTDHISVFRY